MKPPAFPIKSDADKGREYNNLSDFLRDHADEIEDAYRGATTGVPDYCWLQPEIDCVVAVMRALEGALDFGGARGDSGATIRRFASALSEAVSAHESRRANAPLFRIKDMNRCDD